MPSGRLTNPVLPIDFVSPSRFSPFSFSLMASSMRKAPRSTSSSRSASSSCGRSPHVNNSANAKCSRPVATDYQQADLGERVEPPTRFFLEQLRGQLELACRIVADYALGNRILE